MKNGARTAIDSSGRLVIPKTVRDEARVRPGDPLRVEVVDGVIEIAPEPRAVRIVKRGRLSVAVPELPSGPLTSSEVRRALETVRSSRSARRAR